MSGHGTSEPPPLVVVNGEATEEEVAALVAVVQSMAAAGSVAAGRTAQPNLSEWGAPHRKVRTWNPTGPGGWRASSLPR